MAVDTPVSLAKLLNVVTLSYTQQEKLFYMAEFRDWVKESGSMKKEMTL